MAKEPMASPLIAYEPAFLWRLVMEPCVSSINEVTHTCRRRYPLSESVISSGWSPKQCILPRRGGGGGGDWVGRPAVPEPDPEPSPEPPEVDAVPLPDSSADLPEALEAAEWWLGVGEGPRRGGGTTGGTGAGVGCGRWMLYRCLRTILVIAKPLGEGRLSS